MATDWTTDFFPPSRSARLFVGSRRSRIIVGATIPAGKLLLRSKLASTSWRANSPKTRSTKARRFKKNSSPIIPGPLTRERSSGSCGRPSDRQRLIGSTRYFEKDWTQVSDAVQPTLQPASGCRTNDGDWWKAHPPARGVCAEDWSSRRDRRPDSRGRPCRRQSAYRLLRCDRRACH